MEAILSVIIPVYNMEKYLHKLLDSICSVTIDSIEWIFIDDGSNDDSLAILQDFHKQHNNVQIEQQKHLGACAARNLGLSISTGTYIYFFDSDDYFAADIFSKLISILENEQPDLLIGNGYVVNESYHVIGEKFKGLEDRLDSSITELFLIDSNPGNKIFRREIIDEHQIQFDDVAIHQDLNFYLKYLPFCQKIRYISDFMYYYLVRENSIAHKVSVKIREVIQSMEGVYRFYQQNDLLKQYQKELEYNYVKHLCFQIDKLPQLEPLSDQIKIALEFIAVLKKLNYTNNSYINRERITDINALMAKEDIYRTENYDAIFHENQQKYQSIEKRLTLYNHVLTRWLSAKTEQRNIADKLNSMRIHSIAIYGMGSLGTLLYQELIHSDIAIRYFIDQQAEESLFGSEQTRIIRNTEISEQEPVDAIIVTPVHVYDSIYSQLNDMNIGISVVSLQEILNDS